MDYCQGVVRRRRRNLSYMTYPMKCELIAGVEEEECLWNPSCKGYHSGDRRSQAWHSIHEELQLKGYDCDLATLKLHWKNLRDHWKRRKNAAGSVSQKPWVFADKLKFLALSESPGTKERSVTKAIRRSVSDQSDRASSFSESQSANTVPVQPAKNDIVQQVPQILREQVFSIQDLPNTSDKYERFGAMVSSVLRDLHPELANEKMASICMILFHDGVIVTQNSS